MANWPSSCSSSRPPPATKSPHRPGSRPPLPEPGLRRRSFAVALALLAAGCGHAADPEPKPSGAGNAFDAAGALCRPADVGVLKARLQGSVDAEIDWAAPTTPQCLAGPRPAGDGVRLVYKGSAGGEPLLVIVGIALARSDATGRNVPANVTVVREGAGEFYATQGDDKCALDDVRQEPLEGSPGRYRLSGRGFCMQPARAVGGGAGSVLVSRFDVEAVVEYPPED